MITRTLTLSLVFTAFLFIAGVYSGEPGPTPDERIPLDGIWSVAEGRWDTLPTAFPHRVPVPGLISQAEPAFTGVGLPHPDRECFWYRTTFTVGREDPPMALLRINKANYGTRVFLNGKRVGEHAICFSSSEFLLTDHLNSPGQPNELVIGVGAHIDSLWEPVVTGGEVEKLRYIPGIYDSVSLLLFTQGYIDELQVAPDLAGGRLRVEGIYRNEGDAFSDRMQIKILDERTGEVVFEQVGEEIRADSSEPVRFEESLEVGSLIPWSPESPKLYRLRLTLGGARVEERFGWRDFRLDPERTNRALLNGEPYFFRGTTISLFRFFEDPACTGQPWDPQWVRGFFRKFKSLGLNSARTCISVLPELWYDIADEEGFAFFEEYPIWYALREGVSRADFAQERKDPVRRYGIYPEGLTTDRLAREYTAWMQDLWNHPSVIAWDAQNETWAHETGEAIERVRALDKSNRPWDNGWSPPVAATDYREGHQYFGRYRAGSEAKNAIEQQERPFRLSDLPGKVKIPKTLYLPYQYAYDLPLNDYAEQPCILNEYGYFWLNRDGSPTTLTRPYYDAVLGPDATGRERREHYAYMLQGVTEYWRAVRTCFGVIHVFGLAHSLPPHGATCDNFIDVDRLELDPAFERAMRAAMAPVGLCIEEWQDQFSARSTVDVPIVVTNDLGRSVRRAVSLRLERDDEILWETGGAVEAAPWAQARLYLRVQLPKNPGPARLIARFTDPGQEHVTSRRRIEVEE